ncbi:MAG: DinB family protein [Phycisphaerae bacterium]|nr:DinB family protein [Phycisphaerae bacterium]
MKFDVEQAIEPLSRTPSVMRAMLAGLSAQWIYTDYGENTFSPFDILGHLIHGERADWIPRMRIILEAGTERPFDKYDRYAQFEECAGKSLNQLLDEFEQCRNTSISSLRAAALTPDLLAKRGMHPALGEVTLENLLATWVAHDLNHIAQIARCMAAQYNDAVGPWRQYLSILKSPPIAMDADGAARKRAAQLITKQDEQSPIR